MTNKFPTASWLIPIGAELTDWNDELNATILDIMDMYGIEKSVYNRLMVKDRLVHNFEHWYGCSDLTIYRLAQLNMPQTLNVYNGQPATLKYDKWVGIPSLQSAS